MIVCRSAPNDQQTEPMGSMPIGSLCVCIGQGLRPSPLRDSPPRESQKPSQKRIPGGFDFRHEFVRLGSRNLRSTHAFRADLPANERFSEHRLVAARLLVQNQCEGDSERWETKTRSVTALTTLAGRTIVGPRNSSSRPRLAITMPTV